MLMAILAAGSLAAKSPARTAAPLAPPSFDSRAILYPFNLFLVAVETPHV
jgi:hypothetical protein